MLKKCTLDYSIHMEAFDRSQIFTVGYDLIMRVHMIRASIWKHFDNSHSSVLPYSKC